MGEQGAILFLNEHDGVWELITMDSDQPVMVWGEEEDALKDLEKEGWNIEGPFEMCPKEEGLPIVWITGYGLTRSVH
jgi:hypothetical protein